MRYILLFIGSLLFVLGAWSENRDFNELCENVDVVCERENGRLKVINYIDKDENEQFIGQFDDEENLLYVEVFDLNTKNRKSEKFYKNGLLILKRYSQYSEDGDYSGGLELSFAGLSSSRGAKANGFRSFDSSGKTLRSRHHNDSFIASVKEESKNRIPVLVLEMGGVDYRHPKLQGSWLVNSEEIIDGVDNDKNGLIDDEVGFTLYKKEAKSHRHQVDMWMAEINRLGKLDIDHGTSVASLIVRDIEGVALVPVSGELRESALYEGMKSIIDKEKINLVNMSLAFGVKEPGPRWNGFNGFGDARYQMNLLIKHSPETLFVAAAGNNGHLFFAGPGGLDITETRIYPARLKFDNILSVGSVDTDEIIKERLSSYRLSDFSNYSFEHVDILAPGEGLLGYSTGGSLIPNEGTSFATPYVTNVILRIKKELPNLEILKIKELLLKSVYIPNLTEALRWPLKSNILFREKQEVLAKGQILPVRSGGIIYPERVMAAVKILKARPLLSIEESVLEARRSYLVIGERDSQEYELQLKKFWQMRKI